MAPGDALYLPSLNCNLVSMPLVIDEFDCITSYFKSLSILHDHTLKTLIGVGELKIDSIISRVNTTQKHFRQML